MAYTLQAFIGDLPDLEQNAPSGAAIVSLSQEKFMIPLVDDLREFYEIPFLPLTDEGVEGVPPSIRSLAEKFRGPVAYVEAEFFGGDGTQASAVWKDGSLIFGPLVDLYSINRALRFIGVKKGSYLDEFEALGLGKHRDTNSWTQQSGVS